MKKIEIFIDGVLQKSSDRLYLNQGDNITITSGEDGITITPSGLCAYPVDAVYTSISSTDPGIIFGGTWVLLGSTPVYTWKRTV